MNDSNVQKIVYLCMRLTKQMTITEKKKTDHIERNNENCFAEESK